MRRNDFRVVAASLLLVTGVSVRAAETPRIYALTHVTAVPAPGQTVEDATIVLRDGFVESVRSGGEVPPDAIEIDLSGRFAYPGLIDAASELPAAPSRRREGSEGGFNPFTAAPPETEPGAVHPLSMVHPERRVVDAILPFSGDRGDTLKRFRDLGFTVAHLAPDSGIFRGSGASLLLLADTPVAELLLGGKAVQHGSFQRGRFGQGYPTSLMGAVAAMRQTLLDAGRYVEWSARYTANPAGMERPPRHSAHEALGPLLDGRASLVVHTEHPLDTLNADRIAREFDLDVVIATSSYEAEYAAAIAATGRTLIVSVAFPEKPDVDEDDEALGVSMDTMRRYLDAAAGPATLHEAGIRFALTTAGLENTSSFHKQMRKIVEAGLPAEAALAALTTEPARLLGIDRVVGTIETGKIANVVVLDGPLFEEKSRVRDVFVDGRRFELDVEDRPQADPDAVVDPRGTWTVSIQFGPRTIEREWKIRGSEGDYAGTAETQDETVDLESVELNGNEMTVVFPSRGGRPGLEVVAIVEGDAFVGTAQMGPRTVEVKGKRTSGPEGGAR